MIWFMILLLAAPLCAEPLTENQARFWAVTGDVGLLTQGAAEWIEPQEGLPIEPGDHIRTGEDGRVELALSDNALWILEPETEVVMEHTEINAGRLDLSSGTLMGKVDSMRAAGTVQRWEFNTPAAVVAVRGTEFALEASRQGGTHLGVFEGTVELEPAETAQGLQPPVQVSAGQESVAKRGKPIQIMSRFSPRMQAIAGKRQVLKRRQQRIQNTWSPFTPAVRTELRRKFVSPPPKRRPMRHRTVPARRISH
jgi:hypothetical protein